MSPATLFQIHLVLGYVAWLLPALIIDHVGAFYLLVRRQPKAGRILTGEAPAS